MKDVKEIGEWFKGYWPIVVAILGMAVLLGEARLQIRVNAETIAANRLAIENVRHRDMMKLEADMRADLGAVRAELRELATGVQQQAVVGAKQAQHLEDINNQMKDMSGLLRQHMLDRGSRFPSGTKKDELLQ